MRSLVITAVIIIFCAVTSVVATVAPMINVSTMPATEINESTIQQFNSEGGIVSSQTGLDQYYSKNINIVDILVSIATGIIFIGDKLQSFGMDAGLATVINVILGIALAFDQLMYWGKIPW
jgi:hypothetical protein